MLPLAAALSLLIGVVLGMLGGGGAILTLPMLVYALGVDPKVAIATSLFVVGTTSLAAASVHARAGRVKWKTGLVFGGAAMAGAFGGGHVASFVPSTALLLLFSAVMLVTAITMLRQGTGTSSSAPRSLAFGRSVALGAAVGVLSGLVGSGGGFLIVPALSILGGLAMREAIGTSLFVIALQSFAGFAGHATHVQLDWRLVAIVTGASVVGTVIGSLLGRKVPVDLLRRGFAWLVIVMGLFIIAMQVPLFVSVPVAVLTLAVVLVVTRRRPRDDEETSSPPGTRS